MMRIIVALIFLVSLTRAITLSGSYGVHDPSRMIEDNGVYYVYGTGGNIPSLISTDRINWKQGNSVLKNGTFAWARKLVPGNDGRDIWAPDIIFINGLFYMYYAIAGGKDTAVGLITSPTLNPSASNYEWTDRGAVVYAQSGTPYSTIDPCPFFDANNNLWLSWGSGYVFPATSNQLFVTPLNSSTGLAATTNIAEHPVGLGHIEASYVYLHAGQYYLFWNSGGCCSANATYVIHMARSTSVTGPYQGKGGAVSTVFYETEADKGIHGPGQIGVLSTTSPTFFTYHYYNAQGRPVLGENALEWDSDGWPSVGA